MTGRHAATALFAATALGACFSRGPIDWRGYDILAEPIPRPSQELGGTPVEPEDYATFLRWGELWFRDGAFGNERAVTDVLGLFQGTVQVPCDPPAQSCSNDLDVLPIFAAAVDDLDGVQGNLFQGNGGGHTSNLVLRFPPGATLYGTIPVPEALHTGLDIEAGELWPIGLTPVPASASEPTAHLPNLGKLAYEGAPDEAIRLRLTCAICHYSLDVDRDGTADLHSARPDRPTPNSARSPADTWGVGNQDVHFGWLLALSANPLMGALVMSGPIGDPAPEPAIGFAEWVVENHEDRPDDVLREVAIGMLAQPRGYSDVSPDGILGSIQFPTLYTRGAWPANTDGAQSNESDRNNTVWTGALDFTTLVGQASDRGSKLELPWEPTKPFNRIDARTYTEMITRYAPAVQGDPAAREALILDILGTSDGLPGVMNPEGMVVMKAPTMPEEILTHPANIAGDRIREPADYGGDGKHRGFGMAVLGMRVGIDPEWRDQVAPYAAKYDIPIDDFMNESVSLWLNWLDPPSNTTALLANAAELVPEGRRVFEDAGCAHCHRGPFGTDNRIYRLSADNQVNFGAPRAPTTAGWRVLDRALGPPIDTDPRRSQTSRPLRRFASAPYDPKTGLAYRNAGVVNGLLSNQHVGYKTTALRYLWGSAPYLHDGGVSVGIRTDANPAGDDLAPLLRRAGGDDLIYGAGELVTEVEAHPEARPYANAALSLQALVLESERARVVAHNERPLVAVPPGSRTNPVGSEPVADKVSADSLGIHGVGHPFWIDDEPGGEAVTALVAYLLALDDCPRDLPGGPPELACDAPYGPWETP